MFELLYYKSPSGDEPFIEWLDSLDNCSRARIDVRLDRVRLGNFGDCKSISEGVYELRFVFGPGYRVYFGRVGDKIVVILIGGDKKTQKKDIQKALMYWRSFREANL